MKNKKKTKPMSSLFKPGVLLLLVMSGAAAVVLAGGLASDIDTLVLTLLFGSIAAGGANILNNYIDRDIDRVMERTKGRPLPSGKISPDTALFIGVVLAGASVALFWYLINPLTAVLTLCGILYYVLAYSVLLKSRTEHNIVVGGFAAMFPPAVGWAAVTGTLSIVPILIGLFVVLWTPPHFWALALVYKDDYKRAKVPMLPVVAGDAETRRQIVIYAIFAVVLSIFIYFYAALGMLYLIFALGAGIPFVYLAMELERKGTRKRARELFHYSILYLVAVFMAMIGDYLVV